MMSGYLGVEDVSVSVQGDQHDAGAAQEHGGALDAAHSLAEPALNKDLQPRQNNPAQTPFSPLLVHMNKLFSKVNFVEKVNF